MNRKNRTIYLLIIGLLMITNAVTILLYRHEREEFSRSEAAAAEEQEPVNVELTDVLIAIVDYDTKDAKRIGKYLTKAELAWERVGTIEELDVEKYDAIIIPGGNSVTPSMYGAEKDPRTTDTDIEKDRFQFAAVRMYADAEKPVLGICRGEQLVNNVFGGTTIQHMDEGWHKRYRPMRVAEGTWLYDLLGSETETYHYHHQCVDKLGEGLYATNWDAESGHIEGYEHKTLPIYGLQWHCDSMDERGVDVFREFGRVVKENKEKHLNE